MKVLFDLNVVLDLFLDRPPWVQDVRALVAHVLSGAIEGFICATAVPTLYYVARKTVGTDVAFVVVQRCLDVFEVLPVGRASLESASKMAGRDFEDNVHVAAAMEMAIDAIVTRDAAGFSGAPISILSPAALLAQLAQSGV
jgi:predicted nucleic acid-binding protein